MRGFESLLTHMTNNGEVKVQDVTQFVTTLALDDAEMAVEDSAADTDADESTDSPSN